MLVAIRAAGSCDCWCW